MDSRRAAHGRFRRITAGNQRPNIPSPPLQPLPPFCCSHVTACLPVCPGRSRFWSPGGPCPNLVSQPALKDRRQKRVRGRRCGGPGGSQPNCTVRHHTAVRPTRRSAAPQDEASAPTPPLPWNYTAYMSICHDTTPNAAAIREFISTVGQPRNGAIHGTEFQLSSPGPLAVSKPPRPDRGGRVQHSWHYIGSSMRVSAKVIALANPPEVLATRQARV